MSDEIDQLLAEISDAASLQNAKVVYQAMLEAGIRCPNCNYPQNANRFDECLFSYIHTKKALHRMQRRYEQMLDVWCDSDRSIHAAERQQYVEAIRRNNNRRDELREELKSMFPCNDCRKWYNPTRRIRLLMHSKPVAQPPIF